MPRLYAIPAIFRIRNYIRGVSDKVGLYNTACIRRTNLNRSEKTKKNEKWFTQSMKCMVNSLV
jgi:hypothetical protein